MASSPTLYFGLLFLFSVAAKVNTAVKVHMIIPQMIRTKKSIFILQCCLSTCSLWGGNKPANKKHHSLFMAFCYWDVRSLASFSLNTPCIVSVHQFVLGLLKLNSNLTRIVIEYLFYFSFSTSLLPVCMVVLNAKSWTRGMDVLSISSSLSFKGSLSLEHKVVHKRSPTFHVCPK